MIHAHDAYRIANNVNKNICINRSMTFIDGIVKNAANSGKTEVIVNPNQLTLGAETFSEAAESLIEIETRLMQSGYCTRILPSGEYVIKW